MSHALRLGSNDVPLLEINIEHMTVKLDVTCHVVEYSGLSFHKLDWTRLIVQPQNMDLKMLQENTSHEDPLQPFPFSVVIFWCIFFNSIFIGHFSHVLLLTGKFSALDVSFFLGVPLFQRATLTNS